MKQAFSLVELSIVLVILGLLTGGILAGQSLIRASELRAVSTEYQRFTTAIGTFRDKYFAIPGDFASATKFWATSGTCPGLSGTAATGVCNGDGNGSLAVAASTSNEIFGFWEHLAYAGLVEGSYTGNTGHAATATDPTTIIGTNVPRGKISNTGWTAYGLGVMTIADTNWFDSNYGLMFFFGRTQTGNLTYASALKPEEAWNLDTKMDDGRPATGSVMSPEWMGNVSGGAGYCTNMNPSNSASLTASNYNLTNTGTDCSLLFKSGY